MTKPVNPLLLGLSGVLAQNAPTRPYTMSRRLPLGMEKQINRYAQDIGLMMWAWNRLHAHLFEIFWHLLTKGRATDAHLLANSLWHQIQSDKTQREMLLAAARAELQNNKAALARIEWLCDVVGKLSQGRNVGAHVYAVFSPHSRKRPLADPRANRIRPGQVFELIDHRRFWRALTGDLNVLAHYALRVSRPIYGFREPWPRRPTLQCPQEIQRINQTLGKQTPHPKQGTRRSSGQKKGKL
jgi:hypothetical protein